MEGQNDYISIEIHIRGDLGDPKWIHRTIQTRDPELAKKAIKSTEGIVRRYEDLGCHIVR